MRNLYDILGVSRSATQDEIQKAYRNLARELHPDRNPGNKRSEDQLKEASAAYSILKDPEKRGKYNLMGEASMRPNAEGSRQNPQQPKDMNEWMDQMFRQSFGGSYD